LLFRISCGLKGRNISCINSRAKKEKKYLECSERGEEVTDHYLQEGWGDNHEKEGKKSGDLGKDCLETTPWKKKKKRVTPH